MGRLVLRGLMTRKLRSVLTAIAIVLGVAMISGTFVLTDQISGAFDSIFQAANKGTDAVVKPTPTFGSENGNGQDVPLFVPESLVAKVQKVDGVRAADGELTENGFLVLDGKLVKPTGGAPPILASRVTRLPRQHARRRQRSRASASADRPRFRTSRSTRASRAAST